MAVLPSVISEAEAHALIADSEASLRRRRYQSGHWDLVIERYKEVEKHAWSTQNQEYVWS